MSVQNNNNNNNNNRTCIAQVCRMTSEVLKIETNIKSYDSMMSAVLSLINTTSVQNIRLN